MQMEEALCTISSNPCRCAAYRPSDTDCSCKDWSVVDSRDCISFFSCVLWRDLSFFFKCLFSKTRCQSTSFHIKWFCFFFYFLLPNKEAHLSSKTEPFSLVSCVSALMIYSESARKQKCCTTWQITGTLPVVRYSAALQTQITRSVAPMRLLTLLGKKENHFVAFAFIVCGRMCSLPWLRQGSTDLEGQSYKTNKNN